MKSHHSDCTHCGIIVDMRCSVPNKTNTRIVFIFHVSPDKQLFNSSNDFFHLYIICLHWKLFQFIVRAFRKTKCSINLLPDLRYLYSRFGNTKKHIYFFAGSRNYTLFAKHCRLGQVWYHMLEYDGHCSQA